MTDGSELNYTERKKNDQPCTSVGTVAFDLCFGWNDQESGGGPKNKEVILTQSSD